MILSIYTDGGSKGNPGPASIGIAYYLGGKIIHTYREDLGVATNNEAEYTAVIRALEKIKNTLRPLRNSSGQESSGLVDLEIQNVKKIHFYCDSSLVVNQLNGLFKVKHPGIREFVLKVRILEQEVNLPITYTHIPREKNTIADALVNNTYV